MTVSKFDNFRILLVDEDAAFRQRFTDGIDPYGVEVISAAHGVDALMQYKANDGQFSAIIIDHKASNRGGGQLVRQFLEQGYSGRFILVSEGMSRNDFLKYADCGVSGFFSKPFDVGLLAALLLRDA